MDYEEFRQKERNRLRKWRKENPLKAKEQSRRQAQKNKEKIAKKRKTPEARKKMLICIKRWREKNKEKYLQTQRAWKKKNRYKINARFRITNAIRRGKMNRPSICENCKKTSDKIEAHHHDYSKPFEVKWLCALCHFKQHGKMKDIL